MNHDMIIHNGGCHCRRVRRTVQAPRSVVAWKCNYADCSKRGNVNFSVPSESFELLGDSKEFLTTYTSGTHTAKHTFCKCMDPGTLWHIKIKHSDGRNWECSHKYHKSGIAS